MNIYGAIITFIIIKEIKKFQLTQLNIGSRSDINLNFEYGL